MTEIARHPAAKAEVCIVDSYLFGAVRAIDIFPI